MAVDLTGKAVKRLRLPTVNYDLAPVPIVSAQVGDASSRVLLLSLYDDAGDIDLSTYNTTTLRAVLPSGDTRLLADTEPLKPKSTQIIVKIPSGILLEEGRVSCNVILYGSEDKVLTSQPFYIMVSETNGSEDGEEATEDITNALNAVMAAASAAQESAKTAADKANSAQKSAEDAKTSAEQAAKDANSAANSAESAAGDATAALESAEEAERSAGESAKSAQAAQVSATAAAKDAKKAADIAAEAKQIAENNVPIIGDDGNWHVNGVDTEKPYVLDVDAEVQTGDVGSEIAVTKTLNADGRGVTFNFTIPEGKELVSVVKEKTEGLVDTYKISYNDGTNTTFEVVNGRSGVTGVESGESTSTETITETPITFDFEEGNSQTVIVKAKNGDSPTIGEDGNWYVGDVDTGKPYALDVTAEVIAGEVGSSPKVERTTSEDGRSVNFKFTLPKPKDGVGIASIKKKNSSGLVDTYEILYTDDTSTTFEVHNGRDGVGISNITKGTSEGLVDYYTINYTNGSSTKFTVTNGKAATISVGKVTTLPYGEPAFVKNVGNEGAAEFEFGLPSGASGVIDVVAGEAINTEDGYMETPITFEFSEGAEKTVNIKTKNNDTVIEYNKRRALYFWEGTESELAEYTVPEDRTPMLHFVEGISLVTSDAIAEGMNITSTQLKQLSELAKLMFVDTSTQPPTIYLNGTWQQTDNLDDLITEKIFTLSAEEDSVALTGLTDYGKTLINVDIPATYGGKPVTSATIKGSDNLTSLSIPASVTTMSITYCPSLSDVTVDPENTTYQVLGDCLVKGKTVVAGWGMGNIPDDGSVTSIADEAFAGSGVVNIAIPYPVTSLSNEGTFKDCKNLRTIVAANPELNGGGIYTLPILINPMLRGCESLETISLPFTECVPGEPPSNWLFNVHTFARFFIPSGYDVENPEKYTTVIQKIGSNSHSFLVPKSLKTLRIIGGTPYTGAFANFTMLEEVSISGVTTLKENVFNGCSGIKTLSISEDLTSNLNDFSRINIETLSAPAERLGSAYFNISILKTLNVISGSVLELNGDFNHLEELTLSPTITTVYGQFPSTLKRVNTTDLRAFAAIDFINGSWQTFDNKAKLYVNETPITTDLILPDGTTKLGINVFDSYGTFENVILPETVSTINSGALQTPINNLTLSAKVQQIQAGGGGEPFETIENLYINDFTVEEWVSIKFGGSDVNPFMAAENVYANGVKLSSITIPATVTEIGQYAFDGFRGDLIIAEGNPMTKIGDYAFYGYKGSSTITIPATVTEIGQRAFSECDYAKLVFPEGSRIEKLGDGAFGGNVRIDNVVIADGVTTLGSLNGAKGLRKITLPNTLTELPSMSGCASMISLVIPESVTSIPEGAFYGCIKLAEVYNLSNVTIDTTQLAVEGIGVVHTSLDEPSIYERDGDFVFINDNGKYTLWFYEGDPTDVVFPLTHNDEPFVYSLNCVPRPVKITFPTIEPPYFGDPYDNEAFQLNRIFDEDTWEFIEEVKILSGKVFGGNDTFRPPTRTSPPYEQPNNIKKVYIPNNICRVDGTFNYLPDACFNEYENGIYIGSEDNPYLVLLETKSEGVTSLDIHDGCRAIDRSAFYSTAKLVTHLTIPDSIVFINAYSSFDELNLENAVVHDNATYIGNETNPYAVLMKVNDLTITSIDIPETTKVIAPSAFCDMNTGKGCSDLTSLTLPNGLKGIGMYSFALAGITSLTIPDGVEYIDITAFGGCPNLQSVVFPDTMKEIPAGTFMQCGFETFTVQEGIEVISPSAFQGSKLVTITLPSTLKNIGVMAFAQCTTLTAINYNGTKEEWSMITKGDGWDDQTGTYVVHCTDGDVAKGEEV